MSLEWTNDDKFEINNIMGNPIVYKSGVRKYTIIYFNPETSEIEKYEDISRSAALKLPFINKTLLDLIG